MKYLLIIFLLLGCGTKNGPIKGDAPLTSTIEPSCQQNSCYWYKGINSDLFKKWKGAWAARPEDEVVIDFSGGFISGDTWLDGLTIKFYLTAGGLQRIKDYHRKHTGLIVGNEYECVYSYRVPAGSDPGQGTFYLNYPHDVDEPLHNVCLELMGAGTPVVPEWGWAYYNIYAGHSYKITDNKLELKFFTNNSGTVPGHELSIMTLDCDTNPPVPSLFNYWRGKAPHEYLTLDFRNTSLAKINFMLNGHAIQRIQEYDREFNGLVVGNNYSCWYNYGILSGGALPVATDTNGWFWAGAVSSEDVSSNNACLEINTGNSWGYNYNQWHHYGINGDTLTVGFFGGNPAEYPPLEFDLVCEER